MHKIPRDKLFVQVTLNDVLKRLWLLTFFKINCEIYLNPELAGSLSGLGLDRIRDIFDKNGMIKRLHAPVYNACAEDPAMVERSYQESSALCKMLGIEFIVMHAEYEAEKFPHLEDWLNVAAPAWRRIAEGARNDRLTVLIENHHESGAEPIKKMLETTGAFALGACFDIGHFNVFGKKDILSQLDGYPPRSIREVHLSDNMGDGDTHLPLGRGNIDFVRFFKSIDERGIGPVYTIEAKDIKGVVGGMNYLRKMGRI